MLDQQQHEYYLKRILRDLVKDPVLNHRLALKGGTCLYLFYNLPRFSVDLDFNFLQKPTVESGLNSQQTSHQNQLVLDKIEQILSKHLDLDNGRFRQGAHGWLWEASYQPGQRQIQIDISTRRFPDQYQIKQFYGLSIKTLDQGSMFAHKLCAILDRTRLQNRDLFDAWFMFEHNFPINRAVIKARTHQDLATYLNQVRKFVETEVNSKTVLQGLGELMDEKLKVWAKQSLKQELLAQLQLKIDSLQ